MKKLILYLVVISLTSALSAQNIELVSKNGFPILPQKGDWAIGIDAVPFLNLLNNKGSSPGFNFINNIPTISVAYMLADNRALRIEFNADYHLNEIGKSKKDTETTFGLGGGHEWRISKSRVQGFIGAEGGVLYTKTKSLINDSETQTEISTFSGTIDGFLGVEVFFAPKISISGQFSWGPSVAFTHDIDNSTKSVILDLGASNANGAIILAFYF
jgi:hypothetical protein